MHTDSKSTYSPITQLAECSAVNRNVGGSSPPGRALDVRRADEAGFLGFGICERHGADDLAVSSLTRETK